MTPGAGDGAFRRFPVPEFAAACVGAIGSTTLAALESGVFARVYGILVALALVALFVWTLARSVRVYPGRRPVRIGVSVGFFVVLLLLVVLSHAVPALAAVLMLAVGVAWAVLSWRVLNAPARAR